MKIKNKQYFQSFFYFYNYLGYRLIVVFGASIIVGALDGIGLSMFIPLLQMLDSSADKGDADMGKLDFIPEYMGELGIPFEITSILLLIMLFFTLKGFVLFFQAYITVLYKQYFMRKIRINNLDLMNSYKFSEFVKSDAGRIQNTFTVEIERIGQALSAYLSAMKNGALVLAYLSLAFISNFTFALLVAVGGLITNFIFKKLYAKTKKLSTEATSENHQFQGLLIQFVNSFKYLKASGTNIFYAEKLQGKITLIEKVWLKMGTLQALITAIREPLTIFIVVIVILIQIKILEGDLGTVILSLLFLYRAMTFLMAVQEQWNTFLSSSGSLNNLTAFNEELALGKENYGTQKFNEFKKSIVLRDTGFSYDKTPILQNINLNIYKDEVVAFIGVSGSGKTTLMNLISGLYPASEGSIKIDGIDIDHYDLNSFRNKIGYISQEAPTFSDTIYNNITMWSEKTPDNLKKFREVVEKSSLKIFIESLENKEDEMLGSNGINISGGQRQRISIARELYKNVDFLFMDEATSALDGETEAFIQSSIDNLKGAYTILIIAHRLATIKNADKIVLIKKGRIADIGNFKELMDRSGLFREMIALQSMEAKN